MNSQNATVKSCFVGSYLAVLDFKMSCLALSASCAVDEDKLPHNSRQVDTFVSAKEKPASVQPTHFDFALYYVMN